MKSFYDWLIKKHYEYKNGHYRVSKDIYTRNGDKEFCIFVMSEKDFPRQATDKRTILNHLLFIKDKRHNTIQEFEKFYYIYEIAKLKGVQ